MTASEHLLRRADWRHGRAALSFSICDACSLARLPTASWHTSCVVSRRWSQSD